MTEPNEAVITDAKVREELRARIDCVLRENILPFWIEHAVDHENGGFYGALKNDVRVLNDVPRSSVLLQRDGHVEHTRPQIGDSSHVRGHAQRQITWVSCGQAATSRNARGRWAVSLE